MNALEINQRTLSLAFPPLTLATLLTAIGAGILADGTWEFWARVITPLWVGGPLQPAALVQSVFGFQNLPLAELIHLVVGVVFYPLGYLFVAKPIADRFLPFLPWYVVALGYGVGLWVFALYIMAHVFAGLPPFLGFVPLAWASLIGHMAFGFVTGLVVRLRMG
ncbi:hypothetical protein HPQ64_01325 [Rhizobiales bacterium]|uniref:hypothetical protein n=1 Tax=Hongsoonwoonella zoysiae TaxID=2821844 RepID=UPI0015605414|nr:hypothetical protein [Hongsoonwoonella zoysiae]NRG16325.1 hypothetical protein [Hongsoonwoonella zoysiae]